MTFAEVKSPTGGERYCHLGALIGIELFLGTVLAIMVASSFFVAFLTGGAFAVLLTGLAYAVAVILLRYAKKIPNWFWNKVAITITVTILLAFVAALAYGFYNQGLPSLPTWKDIAPMVSTIIVISAVMLSIQVFRALMKRLKAYDMVCPASAPPSKK